VAKQCVLTKNCLKKQTGNGVWGIKWSHDPKGKGSCDHLIPHRLFPVCFFRQFFDYSLCMCLFLLP